MAQKILKVKFLPENLSIKVNKGKSLLQAAHENHILLDAPCGGKGLCGKCLVFDETRKKTVFACKEEITKNSLYSLSRVGFISKGTSLKHFVESFNRDHEKKKKNKASSCSGVAVDLGTTIISVAMIDFNTERIVDVDSFLNPQISYGADVISRLGFIAERSDSSSNLGEIVRKKISSAIKKIVRSNNLGLKDVKKIMVVGNTPMICLFLDMDFSPLLIPPYDLPELEQNNCMVKVIPDEFRIFNKNLQLSTLPIIGGFVGSDITADILALNFLAKKGNCLLIDIGTNGEVVLKSKDVISACSTAAGPAFEGASLDCGMRAASGAISGISIKNGDIRLDTIGDSPPKGICGSGAVEMVVFLLEIGIIDRYGTFINPKEMKKDILPLLRNRTKKRAEQRYFNLTSKIKFTQNDIRSIQLAKSAVRTGIDILSEQHGLKIEEIEECYITGSFGNSLSLQTLKKLGIIPQSLKKISFIEAGALKGAIFSLLSGDMEKYLPRIKEIKHIPIVSDPTFQNKFIDNLNF